MHGGLPSSSFTEKADGARTDDGLPLGWKRRELQEGRRGDYFAFVNGQLLPHLRQLTGAGAGVKTNLVFFTRGRRTERIWYYDLSHVKVGKKTPLTLQHFSEFFDLAPRRGTDAAETARSWTVDFAARRERAREEAGPFRREAESQRQRAAAAREQAKAERKADRQAAAGQYLEESAEAERLAREASAKAQGIEDAIYDLKAVNPTERRGGEDRTPLQLLDAIEARGRDVDAALAALRSLMEI